jgi:hypothetical protein
VFPRTNWWFPQPARFCLPPEACTHARTHMLVHARKTTAHQCARAGWKHDDFYMHVDRPGPRSRVARSRRGTVSCSAGGGGFNLVMVVYISILSPASRPGPGLTHARPAHEHYWTGVGRDLEAREIFFGPSPARNSVFSCITTSN